MSTLSSGLRIAAVISGVVLLAVALGAAVARFAAPDRVFLVAALVGTAVAFVGGGLIEPVLRRCWRSFGAGG